MDFEMPDIGEVDAIPLLLAFAAAIVSTWMMSTSGQGLVWMIASFVITTIVSYMIFLKVFGS